MSGTERGYAPTRRYGNAAAGAICLRKRYAMSSTDRACAASCLCPSYAMSGTDLGSVLVPAYARDRRCPVASDTGKPCEAATRCPVLTYRMRLRDARYWLVRDAMQCPCDLSTRRAVLASVCCYAMCGTELAYALRNEWYWARILCYAMCASICCYAMSGTELAYGTTASASFALSLAPSAVSIAVDVSYPPMPYPVVR
eukprot:3940745-Rhodomonas_salina.15